MRVVILNSIVVGICVVIIEVLYVIDYRWVEYIITIVIVIVVDSVCIDQIVDIVVVSCMWGEQSMMVHLLQVIINVVVAGRMIV